MSTVAEILDSLTVEGTLYERLPEKAVRCFACGHRCLIREGKRGICQVRFNQAGTLRVPWGYTAALQADPIEKKPFFHVMPGSNALTFGMLGCDYHCGYCFTGDTLVVTDRGPIPLEEAFELGEARHRDAHGEISFVSDLRAVTASGRYHQVQAVFRHPYQGEMIELEPLRLPSITCTPDHRIFATTAPGAQPQLIHARDLTTEHYLVVPRVYEFPAPPAIDTEQPAWRSSTDELQQVLDQSGTAARTRRIGLPGSLPTTTLAPDRLREEGLPEYIFDAPREVAMTFLHDLTLGVGQRGADGNIGFTTASKELAHGVAWLALKCGYFPSVYDTPLPETCVAAQEAAHPAPHQYSVEWHAEDCAERSIIETENFHLVPIRGIKRHDFQGQVFNLQVQGEHNYLANFMLVSNCQNWLTSQALRDPDSDESINYIRKISPTGMVDLAHRTQAGVIASSYNEPLITSEWAVGIFKEARAAGLLCAYVSNGNNTPEVMEYIRPYISAYKVDLKCMQDKNYRKLGGVLQHTLDGIQRAHAMGLWVEIVTLTIPGFNDSNEELWEAARFIAGISRDIPWHVTAFHKDYKMTDPDDTDARTLLRAAEIGREAGLNYVYAGNLPGRVGDYEHTFCPGCNTLLIRRAGYVILEYQITGAGTCPACGTRIPGLWPADPAGVQLNGFGAPIPVH
jgi:pyruvate formate lyase activating enzyme